jgi:hypothetical protein
VDSFASQFSRMCARQGPGTTQIQSLLLLSRPGMTCDVSERSKQEAAVCDGRLKKGDFKSPLLDYLVPCTVLLLRIVRLGLAAGISREGVRRTA